MKTTSDLKKGNGNLSALETEVLFLFKQPNSGLIRIEIDAPYEHGYSVELLPSQLFQLGIKTDYTDLLGKEVKAIYADKNLIGIETNYI